MCTMCTMSELKKRGQNAQPGNTVKKERLLEYIRNGACHNARMAAVSKQAAGDDLVHTMLYEDFVKNRSEEVIKLFRYLGLPTDITLGSSSFTKRSAANVTTMLLNADAVIGWLQSWGRKDLPLLDMLRDTRYQTFPYNASTVCIHLRTIDSM